MTEKKCSNIMVRGVNWIGDAVMTMPALRALKAANPDAKITLLAKPHVARLFEKDPAIDETISCTEVHKGLWGMIRLAGEVRKYDFCMALLLQNAFGAALVAFLAGIPVRIGYNRDGRGRLLTQAVPFDERAKALHHIGYYLNLLEKAGFPAKYELPWIYLSIEERLHARTKMKSLRRPVIGINPGATYGSSKRWHPSRFAHVAFRVITEMHGSAVIFGGPSEAAIAEEIQSEFIRLSGNQGLQKQLLITAGRTDIRELIALISECDLLVTNDSGPMHIGYAVGTPVVAIFGSTSPEHTGPVGKNDIVIKKEFGCSPCFERECKKNELKCMDMISSGEVFDAVRASVGVKRAVFFDRDGTLCKDPGYLSRMEDFEVLPGIGKLTRLKERGFSLIGVTNQSGIARGLVDENFVRQVNGIFIDDYGFDGFYFCPHHPDEHCSCRKPEPGLLLDARVDYNIDLKRSFVVGDKDVDMLLAKAAGAVGVLVRTGQDSTSTNADFTVENLGEAVDLILRMESA